jgi:hypothetical protein
MKKGQLTIFIIAGIVILIVLTLLMALINFVADQSLEGQRTTAVKKTEESSVVNYFVSVCVENGLKTGLTLIGQQGGYIFEDQWGGLISPEHIQIDDRRVAYAIIPGERSPPPMYPCSSTYVNQAPAFCKYPDNDIDVRFGEDKLPILETGIFSIKSQLERFINNYVINCVDLRSIAEETGLQSYSLSGVPTTSITFGADNVIAKVQYPLTIQSANQESITQFTSIETELPVRLKQLYGSIKEISQKDIRKADFNIASLSDENEIGGEQLLFASLQNPPQISIRQLSHDDIITINDSMSRIENQSYTFWIARKNRPPVLDYVKQNPSYDNHYDFLVIHPNPFTVIPNAEDPDEDIVKFSFDGYFGASDGIALPITTIGLLPGYYNQTVSVTDSALEDSQQVRILIEPQLKTEFTISNDYTNIPGEIISSEDPFYAQATIETPSLDPSATYTYIWQAGDYIETKNYCSILPGYSECSQSKPSITTINRQLNLQSLTSIQLDTVVEYNGINQKASTSKNVQVVPCYPYRNSEDPSPYPYNINEDPYLSDHTCCLGDISADPSSWRLAAKNEIVCSTIPNFEASCQGGYTLSRRAKSIGCDGIRGNTCLELDDGSNIRLSEWKSTNICGFNEIEYQCAKIPDTCQGINPFSLRLNAGWCHGDEGCSNFCPRGTPIVDVNNNGVADEGDACGCFGFEGNSCDEHADNSFGGICKSNFGIASCSDIFL